MTYVSVAVSALLVGLVLASYLKLVAGQNQSSMRSQAWNRSVAVIEAGVEEALAHLNKNAAPDENSVLHLTTLAIDGWTQDSGGWWKSNSLGDDYYLVRIALFTPPANFPKITAEGYVKQQPAYASLQKLTPWLAQISFDNTRSRYVKRQVVCNTTNIPVWTKALVAKETIDITGQNVFTDSFDSGDPFKSTNRRWDVLKRGDNGDIASNRGVTNATSPVTIGNANIRGRVSTGPNINNPGEGVINVGSQGKVGSLAWHERSDTAGKIQPGWSRDDMNVEFTEVSMPGSSATDPERLDPVTGRKYSIGGVDYDMYLRNGTYRLGPNETLSGKIYVDGNANLIVQRGGGVNMSGGSDMIVIASNACLRLYVDAPSTSIGGSGVQNPGVATNFYYFGTTNNTEIAYAGNANFTGAFYAPSAYFTLNGGGGGVPVDFSGAGIFKRIKMNGNFSFHYDEALRRIGLYRGYILTSWDER